LPLQGVPPNFTVVWDAHPYTYRTDANRSYWITNEYTIGYGVTVHCSIGQLRHPLQHVMPPLSPP
jgi:hypothetical protein